MLTLSLAHTHHVSGETASERVPTPDETGVGVHGKRGSRTGSAWRAREGTGGLRSRSPVSGGLPAVTVGETERRGPVGNGRREADGDGPGRTFGGRWTERKGGVPLVPLELRSDTARFFPRFAIGSMSGWGGGVIKMRQTPAVVTPREPALLDPSRPVSPETWCARAGRFRVLHPDPVPISFRSCFPFGGNDPPPCVPRTFFIERGRAPERYTEGVHTDDAGRFTGNVVCPGDGWTAPTAGLHRRVEDGGTRGSVPNRSFHRKFGVPVHARAALGFLVRPGGQVGVTPGKRAGSASPVCLH